MFALLAPPPPFPWETCKYKDPETHAVSHEAVNALFSLLLTLGPDPSPKEHTKENKKEGTNREEKQRSGNRSVGQRA